MQFGSIQFHDGLAGPQGVALPGENLFDPTAAARTYMHFVHLDCSGDGIVPMAASRGEERQRKQRCAANTIVDLSSRGQPDRCRIVAPILQISAAPLKQFGMAGYSSIPLAQKLGIKPATTVVVINEPANYRKLIGAGADGVEFSKRIGSDSSFI